MRVLALLLSFIALTWALPAIHVKGNKFFDNTGKQFYVVGLDYQPSVALNDDPIADSEGLKRDLPYLTGLGINIIRVYSADATLNHDAGMKMLSDAGIYVLFDATDKLFSINPRDPSWSLDLFTHIKAKIDALRGYDNVFGFLVGNEVIINGWGDTVAAPYLKASIRDAKAYLKSVGSSALVGYAATDIDANGPLQQYLDCKSIATSVDFYGINTYRWCNGDDYKSASYALFNKPYDAPVVFTEFGCIREKPRQFKEVQAIFGIMNQTLSGGFAYEYSQEDNNYGIVQISNNQVTTFGDYTNLQTQYKNLNLQYLTESSYNVDPTAVLSCPQPDGQWLGISDPLPPAADSDYCQCMMNTLQCTVNPSASSASISSAVSTACGGVSCAEINADSSTATYGKFSACTSIQRSSYAINQYYIANKDSQGSDACNFNGVGQIVANPKGCSSIVTSVPTKTASASKSATASSSASQSASASSSASQSATASQVVSATAVVVEGNVTQTATVSSSKSASVTRTNSVSASLTQTNSVSASLTQSATQTDQGQNKYNTQWDEAFGSASSTLPLLGLVVVVLMSI